MADDSATREGATSQNEQDPNRQIDKQLTEGEGAPAEGGDERTPQQRPPTARELAMADIERQRDATLRAEGVEIEGGEPPPKAATDELDTTKQLERQALADDEPLTLEAIKGRKFKHSVDGVEHEFTMHELVRRALKGEAADYRLEQATKTLEEAKALASELKGRTQPAADGNQGEEAAPAGDPRAAQTPLVAEVVLEMLLGGKLHNGEPSEDMVEGGSLP